MGQFHGKELLTLVDNLGAVGLLFRGRSSRADLNAIANSLAGLEAASGIRQRAPWISKVYQPADGGTRLVRRQWATEAATFVVKGPASDRSG